MKIYQRLNFHVNRGNCFITNIKLKNLVKEFIEFLSQFQA